MDVWLPALPGLSPAAGAKKGAAFPVTLWRRPLAGPALPVAVAPDVEALIAQDACVATGVSGGKDSVAVAIAVARHLDAVGHRGPRVLVHADLGRVEWNDTLGSCERLAAHLGMELLVVRRQAGDMLARWQGRWANNIARYRDLSCVRLILPWSTPSLRFCTSEMKTAVITSALKKRFPDHDIVNVTGVRRQESPARAKMPVSAPMTALCRRGKVGVTWNAIIEWPVEQVVATIDAAGLPLHEAYTRYGASRLSCCFCIMSNGADLRAAAGCVDNHAVYRAMVELEAASSFAFQGARWLGDVAPDLLGADLRLRLAVAKEVATERQRIEAEIPKHLHYTAGWPTVMPSREEAEVIASVRRRMAALLGIEVYFTEARVVLQRYAELMAAASQKAAA